MANDDVRPGNAPDSRPGDETVDDILAGILNGDGSFNEEFGEMMTRYLGAEASHVASLRGIDLSSRADEPRLRPRVEYEDPGVRSPYERNPYDRGIDRRIEERMPEDTRYLYREAAASAQSPEFTSRGDVRYPSMGVGASEERVVYDAEWEERARQEAARLQRVREDRMLRGDSTYVRSFVVNGRLGPVRSPYIDPLSADDDFDEPYRYEQNRQGDRRSFFQEGPPVTQGKNRANRQRSAGSADGRTNRRPMNPGGYAPRGEDEFSSFADAYERQQEAKSSWLQPDEEGSSAKKRKPGQRGRQKPQITTTLRDDYDAMSVLREGEGGRPVRQPPAQPETLTQPPHARRQPAEPPEQPQEKEPVAPEELARAEQEAQGLRSTVAEIVDKYNKRSEEEAQAREAAIKAELARQEAARQERERFLQSLPEDIAAALNEENAAGPGAEGYDDFSGVRPEELPPQPHADSLRAFAEAHAGSAQQNGAGPEEGAPQDGAADAPEDPAGGAPEAGAEEAPAAESEPQDYSVYLDRCDGPL